MNLEASLKAWNEGADKYGMSQGYRDAFVNAIRALCSEPTPIKIEDLRIGMRVRTKGGVKRQITTIYGIVPQVFLKDIQLILFYLC
jgi:hypothetical protein